MLCVARAAFASLSRHWRSLNERLPGPARQFGARETEGLGRPREAEQASIPSLPDDPAAIEQLSWHELQALAVIHLPHFERDLLRERLAGLSDTQRRVLRETLDEVA
jgi:hypothetical protein